jgi:hypothetical protein
MKRTLAAIGLLAAQLMVGGPAPKTATSSAPPPKLLREIDLNQIIAGVGDATRTPAFSFSPDEM